ncbi:hypothetical protein PACTADRAFT_46118, partial [Pachysolen tannophilus NRRL Y-2460]
MIWRWGDPADALSRFGKYKSTIPVRGAALFNEELDKVLLVKGTESNSWGFPRGKISKEEKDVDCAIREILEETGFDISDYIDEDEYIERTIKGKNYRIYLIKDIPEEFNFQPTARNEISCIEWKSLKYLNKDCKTNNNHYFLVSAMLKPMLRFVNKMKGLQNEE